MSDAKVLVVGVLNKALQRDPRRAMDTGSMFVHRQVFQSPFEVPPGGDEVVPVLFERFENVGNDRRSYRAKVVKGPRFSDGSMMEPDDVYQSLLQAEIVRDRAAVSLDGDHVVFRLHQPDSGFQMSLSYASCAVCRSDGSEILGSGPFKVAPDDDEREIRLIRNPHYPKELALDEIVFRVYPVDSDGHSTALLAALEAGEVHLTNDLARDDVRQISKVRKSFQPGNSTALLFFNTQSPKLEDPRVRRALAHSIDRLKAAECCYSNPLAFSASSLLPRGLATIGDDLGHSAKRAEALFSEPGVIKPTRLTMLVIWGPRPYLPKPNAVTEFLIDEYRAVGIEIVPTVAATGGDYFQGMRDGSFDIVLGGWAADTPDPCDYLDSLLHSDRIPGPTKLATSANISRLRSSAIDEALGRYRSERTPSALAAVISLADEEAPILPLIYGSTSTVSSFQVTNLMPSPMPIFSVAELDLQTRWG